MKKSILLCMTLLLSLCLVFGMVACGDESGTDVDTQGATEAAGTEANTVADTVGGEADTTAGDQATVGETQASGTEETVAESTYGSDETAAESVVGGGDETVADTTAGDTGETGETEVGTNEATTNEVETAAPAVTEAVTEAETELQPFVMDFNAVSASDLKSFFSGANQTTYDVATDNDGEQYVVMSTSIANATDPYVSFNASGFLKKAGIENVTSVKDYKYILMKVRQVGCSSGSFDLYYYTGRVFGATGGMNIMEGFDVSEDGWQYILFDMSNANGWTGKINGFRFDYMLTAEAVGETFHIAELQLLANADEYYKGFDVKWDDIGIKVPEDAKQEAESLLASTTKPITAYDSYEKENATNEDASLKLWFDHMYTRAPQSGAVPTDRITYQILLAKNETEGCQFVLAPEADMNGLKVFVTDFENADGDTLKTDLHWGYYFEVDGQYIIDPLPPVTYDRNQAMLDWCNGGNTAGSTIPVLQKYDGFDIKGGESQSFVLKATTAADTKPGEYSATITVMSADGKEIKKATVFVYVWNFTLSDESDCKTLMDMGSFDIYVTYYDWGADLRNDKGQNLYEAYYNFMLDYRVNCYTLPTESSNGNYGGSTSYLNNPRVQAFLALGWKTAGKLMSEDGSGNKFGEAAANAYNSLSQNPEWLDKAYFYPVDEPGSISALDSINQYGAILQEKFPGYKLIAPMHINYATAKGDYFSYVKDYVNVWCPKTFFYNTFAEWFNDRTLEYGTTPGLEEKLGSLRDRFYAEKAEGDELWWYVTRFPNNPEITFIINTDAVNIRTVFWQTKLYDVDGFLYYSINHWNNTEGRFWVNPGEDVPYYNGLNQMHEINSAYPYEVYGNGILIYTGAYFAQTDPVASLRLESIRDGIEDYEYLSILEEFYGKDVVNGIISTWTTSLGDYSTDVEAFRDLRAKLGALVEAAVNAQ